MLESNFRDYLSNARNFKETTINGRIASCRRVELYEGNLDQHFDNDQCRSLLRRLTYSAEDRNQQRPLKHSIPINGNVVTGSATLKRAVILYVQFRGSSGTSAKVEGTVSLRTHGERLHDDTPRQRRAAVPRVRGGREANPVMSGSGCLIAALWAIVTIALIILVVVT